MLFSASFPSALNEHGDALYFIRSQVIFAAAGIAAMMAMSKINYQRLRGVATLALIGSLALLVLVVLPGPNAYGKLFGIERNHSVRWMQLLLVAGPQYQPSELAKLGIIIYFAATISQRRDRIADLQIRDPALWADPSGLCGPDADGGPTCPAVSCWWASAQVMMVVGGMDWKWVTGGILGVCAGLYAMLFTDLMEIIGYNSSRIQTWRDPFWDGPGRQLPDGTEFDRHWFRRAVRRRPGAEPAEVHVPSRGAQRLYFRHYLRGAGVMWGAGIIMILFALLIIRGYWIAIHARGPLWRPAGGGRYHPDRPAGVFEYRRGDGPHPGYRHLPAFFSATAVRR